MTYLMLLTLTTTTNQNRYMSALRIALQSVYIEFFLLIIAIKISSNVIGA